MRTTLACVHGDRIPTCFCRGTRSSFPDKQIKNTEVGTGRSTRFQVVVDKIFLRLKLEELFGKPLANVPCEIRVDGKTVKKATNDEAMLEIQVGATTQEAELVVRTPTVGSKTSSSRSRSVFLILWRRRAARLRV